MYPHDTPTFGRDPITPVAKLLEPKPRYYGEKGSSLKMDTLRRLYAILVENIRKARSKKLQLNEMKPHRFKVDDIVLVKDPDFAVFEPRYQPNYQVTAIFGDHRIEVQDEKGHKSIRRSSHVKYVELSEKVVQQFPSKEMPQKYGRSSRLLITDKDIPDLQFKVNRDSEFPEHSQNSLDAVREVVEVMETNVLPHIVSEVPTVNLQSSENRKHSGDSLTNVVSVTLEPLIAGNKVKSKFVGDGTGWISEYRDSLQNSRRSEVDVALQISTKKSVLQDYGKQELTASRTLKQSEKLPCSPAAVAQ